MFEPKGIIKSTNMNVFLASALFAPLDDIMDKNALMQNYCAITKENKFKCIFALSIQKETYIKIYEFLKKEGQEW